jgi:hypothetical protein
MNIEREKSKIWGEFPELTYYISFVNRQFPQKTSIDASNDHENITSPTKWIENKLYNSEFGFNMGFRILASMDSCSEKQHKFGVAKKLCHMQKGFSSFHRVTF